MGPLKNDARTGRPISRDDSLVVANVCVTEWILKLLSLECSPTRGQGGELSASPKAPSYPTNRFSHKPGEWRRTADDERRIRRPDDNFTSLVVDFGKPHLEQRPCSAMRVVTFCWFATSVTVKCCEAVHDIATLRKTPDARRRRAASCRTFQWFTVACELCFHADVIQNDRERV